MEEAKKIIKENAEDIIALAPMQEGMLFHYLKEPEGDQYFQQLSLRLVGKIELQCLEKAWDYVIETNELLRAVYRWEKLQNPVQVILKRHYLQLDYHDFSIQSPNIREQLLEEVKRKDKQEKFDLKHVPFRVMVCKMGPDTYEMIISNHHILYDGWSNGIILKEFIHFYNVLMDNKTPVIPVKSKYKEFINWLQEKQWVGVSRERFWKEYLQGFAGGADLSLKRKKEGEQKVSENCRIKLSSSIKSRLECFARGSRVTLAAVFYSVWGIILQKLNHHNDVLFGQVASGRTAKITGIESMVGLFVNTLPLRLKTQTNERILDIITRINRMLKKREEYEGTSLVDIKTYCGQNKDADLFDSIVIVENYPLDIKSLKSGGHWVIKAYSMFETSNFDITAIIKLFDDIEINFSYNRAIFDKETIQEYLEYFKNAIAFILDHPENQLKTVEIIPQEKKTHFIAQFNEALENE